MAQHVVSGLRRRLQTLPTALGLAIVPLFQRLSGPASDALGVAMGRLAFRVWGRVRRIAIKNLKASFPMLSETDILNLARASFEQWGIFFLLTARLPALSESFFDRMVTVEGLEHLESALARGRGVVLISGHFGCFELGASFLARSGWPTSVVARYAKTPELTEQMTRVREAAGYKVLCYDARGFRAMRNLKNNEIVCILIDQDEGTHGAFVTFFGRPASTVTGPAVLAARSGAALLPGWVIRQPDGHYHMIVEPEVPNPGRRATPEDILQTTQALTSRLEAVVRRHPEHWLWMHRRWKTQPSANAPTPSTTIAS